MSVLTKLPDYLLPRLCSRRIPSPNSRGGLLCVSPAHDFTLISAKIPLLIFVELTASRISPRPNRLPLQ